MTKKEMKKFIPLEKGVQIKPLLSLPEAEDHAKSPPVLTVSERNSLTGFTLSEWAELCHSIAVEKGFWDEKRNMGEALMLIVTELAEAMESYRLQEDENFREELADTFIRLLDLCGGLKIDIEGEIQQKCLKNKQRPYKHGKIC